MAKAIMYSLFKAYSMEKFPAWWVNSTRNSDIARIAKMSAISRGIHSSGSEFFFNHIAKATWVKLKVFSREQCALSKSMRFLVVLSVNGFLFSSKFGSHSFSVNSFISKMFIPRTSCIFDSNNFCSRLMSAIYLHAQVQIKYPLQTKVELIEPLAE